MKVTAGKNGSETGANAAPHDRPRRWFQLVLAGAIIIPGAWFAAQHLWTDNGSLISFGSEDAPLIATLFAALALVMLTNGLVLRDLTAQFGIKLDLYIAFGITLVASMLNLVSPIKGGAAVRAIYLKRMHGVSYGSFANVLAASVVCSLAVSAALAAASLVALGVPGGRFGWVALGVSIAIVTALTLLLRFAPPTPKQPATSLGRIAQAAQGWRTVSGDRVLFAKVIAWSVVGVLLHALAFVVAFRVAGFSGDWLVPVFSSAFARIGALIAITPAGLGIFEAFGTVSATIVGADPASALAGIILVRAVATAVSLIGGISFSHLLLRPGPRADRAGNISG